MPELPEVESIRCHLEHHLPLLAPIARMHFFRGDLRSPLPLDIADSLKDQSLLAIRRRAKFLLFETEQKTFISHLGMSGYWRLTDRLEGALHDHVAFEFSNRKFLIYQDPRRFGIFEAVERGQESTNRWLKNLGVEPLSSEWSQNYLFIQTRHRRVAIKNFLLNQQIVVGLGNIYASETLFLAKIRPTRWAAHITRNEAAKIVEASRRVLQDAIQFGGTTLRDYLRPDGDPGRFKSRLHVYDREGQFCRVCKLGIIRRIVQSTRSTYYCPKCQGRSLKFD